jgi:hypothetical protein
MPNRQSKNQRGRSVHQPICYTNLFAICPIILSILLFILVACAPSTEAPKKISMQAALPTPTLEPTFTPSPPPTNTPQSSPTATLAKSTPISTPVEPTLTATPQSSLSGLILDQDTGQPVAGAKVIAGSYTATTDADGAYTLIGLPPGQYILSVTHPNYDPGLSSIFTLAAGQEFSLDLALYAPSTSPYPKDPMLTNPLDPDSAPTPEDAERLARLQGLTGKVVGIREAKLSGEYLVNYKIGDEVRAAVAELNHDVWELTDDAGRKWWIIKVCGNLASPLPAKVAVATPQPRSLPPMAEVVTDGLIARECTSETCAEVGTVQRGARLEVLGCLADGSWCQVAVPGGGSGWCTGQSLRHLAVAEAVLVVDAVLPTPTLKVVADGTGKIAFDSNRDGNGEIYVMNADGGGVVRLTNHPATDGDPAWSPDGRQIAFVSSRDGNSDIYVMNADGSSQIRLTDNPARDHQPAWLPDGQHIAFVSDRDGNTEIYVMYADGSGLTRATNHPAYDWFPAWSPSGEQIAFTSNRDGSSKVYLMGVDGSGQARPLNNSTFGGAPAWSPDGQQIAFYAAREGTNYEIYVINADGNDLTRLTDNPAFDSDPAWSPSGQQIAFMSDRDGNLEIYVMSADGTGLKRLTNHEAADGNPAWSR